MKKLDKKRPRARKAKASEGRIRILAWLLGAATITGGLAAVLTFLPRPSVSVGDPVDVNNPFSSAFTVTNGNFVPLTDVRVGVKPGHLQIGRLSIVGGFLFNSHWEHHTLGIDEKFTITPADIFGIAPNELKQADLAIVVEYRPWFLPIQRSKAFRFQAHRQTNGQFYWYSIPLQ